MCEASAPRGRCHSVSNDQPRRPNFRVRELLPDACDLRGCYARSGIRRLSMGRRDAGSGRAEQSLLERLHGACAFHCLSRDEGVACRARDSVALGVGPRDYGTWWVKCSLANRIVGDREVRHQTCWSRALVCASGWIWVLVQGGGLDGLIAQPCYTASAAGLHRQNYTMLLSRCPSHRDHADLRSAKSISRRTAELGFDPV